MSDKTDVINSMVNIFEQYGREYTIEQAMQHVADYCNKQFVEQARDLIEGQTIRTEMDNFDAGYNTALNDMENAIRNKFT